MTADEPARGRDPDDWFDEPAVGDVWSARVERVARERQAQRTSTDDWLIEQPAPERRRVRRLPRRGVFAVAALGFVLLFGVLAAAGVFSGSSRRTTPPVTSAPRSTPTTTVTRTATQPPQPALPTTTLKPGDHGAAVAQLQHALAQAGYSPGTIDSSYGPATTQAVKSFQQQHGLTADGVAGPQTLTALRHALRAG